MSEQQQIVKKAMNHNGIEEDIPCPLSLKEKLSLISNALFLLKDKKGLLSQDLYRTYDQKLN